MLIRRAGLICVAICVGYFFAGFWPFDPTPRNRLEWVAGENGIQFKAPSTAYSSRNLELNPGGKATIEVWLASDSDRVGHVYPILALYDGRLPDNLLFAQWKSSLIVRAPGRREAGLAAALPRGERRLITIVSGPDGTSFYVDGVFTRAYPHFHFEPEGLRGRLILGNPAGARPSWNGRMFGLGFYSRALTPAEVARHFRRWSGGRAKAIASEAGVAALYLFNERKGTLIADITPRAQALTIPAHYELARKTVLLPPWRDSFQPVDFVVNVLGFVPFGFFYYFHRRRTRPDRGRLAVAAAVTTAGAVISLVIELGQVYLPTRSSSLTDVICNVAGTLMGAGIALWATCRAERLRYFRSIMTPRG